PTGLHWSRGRGHTPHPVTFHDETGRGHAGIEAGAARPRQLQGQPAWLQPAVTLAKAGVHDIRAQVGKALPRLGAAQQLDIGQAPSALRRDQVRLDLGTLIRCRDEEVALVGKADIHPLLELIEEGDAFPDQLDLFRVVELQPEGAGRHRGGEGCQRRALLENARPKPGALRKQRGCATDDPPTDDDEVGGLGRLAALDEALLILRVVVFGVFVDIAKFLRLPDSLGNLGAALIAKHFELRLQAVQALLGDVDNLVVFHDSPFLEPAYGSVEPPYYTRL